MRFHRNAGARGAAEWICCTPTQSKIHCYARIVLAKDVIFETAGRDGWALGELKWLAEPVPGSAHLLLEEEIRLATRPDALARLRLRWVKLWYRPGQGFFDDGMRPLRGARALLLGPGGEARIWRPDPA